MYCSGTSSTESKKSDSTDELNLSALNLSTRRGRPKFRYPAASQRLCRSENDSSCNSCVSDSSVSDGKLLVKRRNRRRTGKQLPPLGIYWDIENCHVPKNKSAASLVHKIRETFMCNYREAEFVVVCDVKKENPQVIQDLHDTQVSLIHVSSISKNAADEKLRQSLRRFAEVYQTPAAVLLISSDVNFAADLCDLRYRRKIHVILIHNSNVADALILCANETYNFSEITENLPVKREKTKQQDLTDSSILIYNLPQNCERNRIKNRLRLLTDNCGGRVVSVSPDRGVATVRFSSPDVATRAQRRIQGEDVFGNKIKVLNPSSANQREVRSYRKVKSVAESNYQQTQQVFSQFLPAQQDYTHAIRGNSQFFDGNLLASTWKSVPDVSNSLALSLCQPLQASRRNSLTERRSRTPQDGAGADDKSAISDSQPVLFISNLEPTMDVKQLRKLLMNMLKKYAMVLSLNISVHPDGYLCATVKVNSQQEAQYVISQLHRQKLGYRRMVISYMQNESPDPNQLRAMVIALLQEAPGKRMPLFKLLELLETRYHSNVSMSEVNKLKDICEITEDTDGRVVSLTPEVRCSPPLNIGRAVTPYCTVHCPNGIENRGWGEPDTVQTPNVIMSLKVFSLKVNELLTSHMGLMPLLSFQVCYEMEFGEPLPVDENGVPLEHFLTCVHNIELKYGGPNKNVKYIKREIRVGENEEESVLRSVPPSLLPNINLLCREVVDLLKTTERCQLLWNRFIPAYHHHFGRQCRLADYGYTKLQDLFEAIPHVLQLMGDANRRVITLSHQAQMKRFHSDLLRVLKNQHSKQIAIEEFPSAYERTMNKTFNPVEYGLCYLEDLLNEVPSNNVVVTRSSNIVTIAIPKHEQTPEEAMRTRQFANEVVHLLRHTPQCSMLFNKFVPSYHHHFGYQCRVSDFGFTKLIELFEAISDVVKIEELPDGDRRVCLTLPYALKVLGMQITDLIKASYFNYLPLEALPATYLREFGYPLKPEAFECKTILEVLNKLQDVVQVNHSNAGTLLILVSSNGELGFAVRVWNVLRKQHNMHVSSFLHEYQAKYNTCIKVQNLEKLRSVIEITNRTTETCLSLTPSYKLVSELYEVLYNCGGQILYSNLEDIYKKTFSKNIDVSHLEYKSVADFVLHFKNFFVLKGNKRKLQLVLNKQLAEYLVPLPKWLVIESNAQFNTPNAHEEQLSWPPPPAHELVTNANSRKKVTPPKPDTPPASGACTWDGWSTPTKTEPNVNLSIALPKMQTPKLPMNMDPLTSPARTLFHPLDNVVIPMITAPDPGLLPHPDKLLGKGGRSDDSHDSGVINNDSELDAWKF